MMDEKFANEMPPHHPYDQQIPLKEGKEPPFGPLYGISYKELIVLKQYIQDNLEKGFIQAISSPAGAPIVFVKKAAGTLHPNGWSEKWKTSFCTRDRDFGYRVMPFGLTNAPATFQHFINDCVRDYLDMFCPAYLDNILIYNYIFEEHQLHVKKVLEALPRNGVLLKPEKFEFHTQSIIYLGFIMEPNGIKMDSKKVEPVKNWTVPKTAQMVFNLLRKSLHSRSHPHPFRPRKEITVETDASDYVSVTVLSQYNDNGTLRPVTYFSKKHSPAECNYEIYDKELLAIIRSLEEWRPELEGAAHPITVISDHKNLKYFMSTKQINRRQPHWAEYLSCFNFVIKYRPG
ncbi:uncharacterized protein H6S33_007220 [Morchella sextelata]|uniref:uncharacterized protein n=1 Tax=Morchella sextelata TaxID=1174677 RepID=UPI001D04281E|nr:uncharacterized protein H6S33_007220 [Morchella sextelata]KAH0604189.1 hypothetical protein H6S33_007220 [Morchella sextelata]